MIIAKTKLKKIPDKCIKCRFCINGDISNKVAKNDPWHHGVRYIKKICSLTGGEVPYVFTLEKRNWEYTKCKSCPLMEVEE